MKLHEEIKEILEGIRQPLTAFELSNQINSNAEFRNRTRSDVSSLQVQSCINNFPSLFEQINGKTFLSTDQKWRDFLISYSYILNILRGFYSNAELQFFIAVLFLSKRVLDFKEMNLYSIDIPFSEEVFLEISYGDNFDFEKWLKSISEIDNANNFQIEIYSEFQTLLRKLGLGKIREVFSVLTRVDTRNFDMKEFGIAFEYLIEVNVGENYKSGLIRTPPQVIELMVQLLNPTHGTVFDPVCGVGGLLSEINLHRDDAILLKGTEVNYGVAQLAFMNMLMHGERRPNIRAMNCFDELSSSEKFDHIIGDLPLLGVKNSSNVHDLSSYSNIRLPASGKGFSSILIFILAKLSNKGRAVITVSDSFLSAGGADEKVRHLLIADDLIESVISIPANSLKPYTNGKASILILNKAKPSYLINKIKFINATKNTNVLKFAAFDSGKIISEYRERETNGDDVQIVSTREVAESNTLQVNFFVEKFHEVTDLIKSGKAVLLGDLVEMKTGSPLFSKEDANFSEGIPYIKIENLEKDILDMRLSSESLINNFSDTSHYKKSLFVDDILMVARIGDYLKPTYFQPSKNLPAIVTHSNVISLKPRNPQRLNLEYLYYQLYSPFVQKQVEQKRKGAVMPTITLSSLNSLVIPFMSIELQKEFIVSQKLNIISIEKDRVNQRLKLIGFEEQEIQTESDVVSTLVHELRPKLLSFHTFASLLKKKIANVDMLELKSNESHNAQTDPDMLDVIEPIKDYSIQSITEKLVDESERLNDVLNLVKQVMGFKLKQEDFIAIDLFNFISEHLASKEVETAQRFSCEVTGSHAIVDLHCESFKYLIDQLLSNAVSHGFSIPSPADKVIFSIRENRTRKVVTIDYSNNGAPLLITGKDYIRFFQKSKISSGSGIGGNYIYRIVKSHKGELSIKENQKKGFFMTIELPIKQGYDE
ncbi:MAG: N-6 DNA methylase [Bacteroidales bacterium]|nr:N-6 DNA methylase [Bacteroidales bacterium]